MASSSTGSVHDSISPSELCFANRVCRCGKRAAVKISESEKNKNKLYYCCKDSHSGCGFGGWCLPLDPSRSNHMGSVLVNNSEFLELKEDVQRLKSRMRGLEGFVRETKILVPVLVGIFGLVFIILVVKGLI